MAAVVRFSRKHKLKRTTNPLDPMAAVAHISPISAMAFEGDHYREFERRQARSEELRYRIAPDCKVHIQFNGIATKDAIRKLIAYLQMSIEDFPQNAEAPLPPQAIQPRI